MANIIDKINEQQINPNVPEFRVGDTVNVSETEPPLRETTTPSNA